MRSWLQLLVSFLVVSLAQTSWPAAADELVVRGRVESAAGAPVADADVRLVPAEAPYAELLRVLTGKGEPPAPVDSATTGADGRWRLEASPGAYTLYASSPDSSEQFLPGRVVRDVYPPTLEPVATDTLRLTVVSGGEPVPGALVRLSSASTYRHIWRPASQWQRTGADGVAELEAAAGERLRADVVAEGFGPESTPVTGSSRIELPAARLQTVRVEDASGRPVSGALLTSFGVPIARTDDDGLATAWLPADGLRVNVLTRHGASASARLAVLDESDAATAQDSQQPHVITLSPPRLVTGRVIDSERREPLPGALVWLESVSDFHLFAVTDGAGSYELTVPQRAELKLSALAAEHFEHTVEVPEDAAVAPTLALRPAGRLWGSVTNADGEPVEGARVDAMVKPESRRVTFSGGGLEARTDSDGEFRLRGLEPSAAYRLRVTADGYAPAQAEGRSSAPGAPVLGGRTESVEIVLHRGAQAFGRVVDESDEPVAGATVSLDLQDSGNPMERMVRMMRGVGPTAETVTDSEGIFLFQNLAGGSYRLAARAGGFAPASVPGVEIVAGASESDLGTLVLSPGLAVEGVVVDSAGDALAGAQIRVVRRQGGGLMRGFAAPTGPADATSGRDGHFELVDLAKNEQLMIQASLAGYQDGSIDGVRVPSDEPARIVLQQSAEIYGRVVDDTGMPVAGAKVSVEVEGAGMFRRMQRASSEVADADGRFELLDAPPGAVQLTATADGYREAKLGAELEEGQILEDVELTLRPGARIVGTVRDAEGVPVVDARVAVEGNDEGGPASFLFGGPGVATDGDGRFVLDGLETGRQTVVAMKQASRASRVVDVAPGTSTVDFRFSSGATVSGRVLDPDNLPAAEVRLTLQSIDEFTLRFTALSRTDGTFQIEDVAPGSYRLIGEGSGMAGTSLPEPLTVGSDPLSGVELRMSRGQAVVGRLLGADVDALAGAEVGASTQGGYRLGDVNYEGGYRIEGLTPGRWSVFAALADGRRASESVEIEEGLPETVLDLDFEGGETLSGEVVSGGQPAQGVDVSIRGLDVEHRNFTRTDTAGRFEAQGLEPGRYRVTAIERRQGLTAEEEVDVPGPDVRLELVELAVEGRVVDAWDGSAVAGAKVQAEPAQGDQRSGAFSLILRGRNTETDDSGRFRLRGLTRGQWNMEVTKSGYATHSQPVEVLAEGTSVEVALEASEGLWMTVSRADGAAVPKVSLVALDAAGRRLAGGDFVPDDAGSVYVSTVPPGLVHLVVQAPGTAPSELQVNVPEERAAVVLRTGARLEVEVPELLDDPVRADAVAESPAAGNALGRLRVVGFGAQLLDEFPLRRGRASLSGVAPGTWTVKVTAADGRVWSGQVEVSGPGQVTLRLE